MNSAIYTYILGAGASKPDGIPITNELFWEMFFSFGGKVNNADIDLPGIINKEAAYGKYLPVLEMFDKLEGTPLAEIFKKHYDDRVLTKPEVLQNISTSKIEGFFEKLYYLKEGKENYGIQVSQEEKKNIWKNANYVYFNTLGRAMIMAQPKYYTKFIDKMLTREGIHCIISFNYDLMLDDALIEKLELVTKKTGKYIYPENLVWTYGINFKEIFDRDKIPYQFPADEKAKIFYLKLHGSLNWGLCQEKRDVYLCSSVKDGFIYERFDRNEFSCSCYDSNHALLPLAIPPLKDKEIEKWGLKPIWDKATELIAKSNELHILGYSLPEVDEKAGNLIESINKYVNKVIIANVNRKHREKLIKLLEKKVSNNNFAQYNSFEKYLE